MTALPRILGTAGHIDHGKTALVRALTGVDTDRLPEEKSRGITIDIGFAHLELDDVSLGVVDVPGHERFVRNMLAGATGIDIAMLVVAVDDSVMPQTREHLAILELLRVERGVIALSKTDRAEDDWVALVENEVRELVAGTFLESAPIIRTSATAGTGLAELRAALNEVARDVTPVGDGVPFRLAVDRSFVRQGLGTVVTGTVASGSLEAGSPVEWLPRSETVHVRGLQSHGLEVERVSRGQRAAINLMGVHHEAIHRGHELAATGWLSPARTVTARIRVLPESPWPIRHRSRVRVHLGAQEIMATVALLERLRLEPGEEGMVQLFGAEPIVSRSGQPFVVRAESPVITIGGGHIVEPVARRIPRRDKTAPTRLALRVKSDPVVRTSAAIAAFGVQPWTELALCRDADVEPAQVVPVLTTLRERGELIDLPLAPSGRRLVQAGVMTELEARVTRALSAMHAAAPLEDLHARTSLMHRMRDLDERVGEAIIQRMVTAGTLREGDRGVALASFQPKLSSRQRELCDDVVEQFLQASYQPPDLATIAQERRLREIELQPMIELCVSRGQLVHLGGGSFLHAKWEAELRPKLASAYGDAGFTMSELRTLLGTSRKYAVPIGEYLDRMGVTRRVGDRRILRAERSS